MMDTTKVVPADSHHPGKKLMFPGFKKNVDQQATYIDTAYGMLLVILLLQMQASLASSLSGHRYKVVRFLDAISSFLFRTLGI